MVLSMNLCGIKVFWGGVISTSTMCTCIICIWQGASIYPAPGSVHAKNLSRKLSGSLFPADASSCFGGGGSGPKPHPRGPEHGSIREFQKFFEEMVKVVKGKAERLRGNLSSSRR